MILLGATAPYDRGEILRMAEKYRFQRRIGKAIQEYEKILSVDPRDADVHIKVAPLYIRTGRKGQAKESVRQAIAWYEAKGFADKAIAMQRLSLTIDRHDLAAHLDLADRYMGKGYPGDARNVLDAARKAFRGRKYLKEAIAVEEKILGLAPDDFRSQDSLVRLLWLSGKRQVALERLRRMDEQWARRGNRRNLRKTRWLRFQLVPSPSTGRDYMLSLFLSPYSCRIAKRA